MDKFIIAEVSTSRIIKIGLTREQAFASYSGNDYHIVFESDFDTTPTVDKKLYKGTLVDFTFEDFRSLRKKVFEEHGWIIERHASEGDPDGFDWAAWKTYFQEWRDIPQDYTYSDDVVWPTKP